MTVILKFVLIGFNSKLYIIIIIKAIKILFANNCKDLSSQKNFEDYCYTDVTLFFHDVQILLCLTLMVYPHFNRWVRVLEKMVMLQLPEAEPKRISTHSDTSSQSNQSNSSDQSSQS